jgi:hypothetical protein
MKNSIIIILGATALVLSGLCLVQSRKGSEQQAQAGLLRAEVEQKAAELDDLQATRRRADQQYRELKSQADELTAQLQAHRFAETNASTLPLNNQPPAPQPEPADPPMRDFGKILSKMMQDPDARKLVREQQRMMMDQLYAPLVKRMGLTPEEASQFNDMQAEHMVNAAGKAFSVFGDAASTKQPKPANSLTADQKSFDEQIKALLGDARYAQYEAYQETVPHRMQLNAFKQQAGSDYNLTEPQTEALVIMMKEETKNVAATVGLPLDGPDKDPAKIKAMLAEGKMDELLRGQETVSQRVYERARTILFPEQLASFGRFQTNQMQAMRLGMNMAKKMFAPDASDPAGALPNQ